MKLPLLSRRESDSPYEDTPAPLLLVASIDIVELDERLIYVFFTYKADRIHRMIFNQELTRFTIHHPFRDETWVLARWPNTNTDQGKDIGMVQLRPAL